MSDEQKAPAASGDGTASDDAAVTRKARAGGRGGGGGPWGGMGMPAEKALDLRGTLTRFLGDLRDHRLALVGIIVLGVLSVALAVIGPKLLGNATNIVFAGFLSRNLPEGITREQALEGLRASGNDQLADLLEPLNFVPGDGVDFRALAVVLAWVLAVYVGSFLFGWLQARITAIVVQTAMYRLRERVEAKLGRVPLKYFDGQPRGEVLSRVTNDIDNIAQTMSQTLAQLITSVLTVIGVLVMMFVISPLLALIALVTVPLSAIVTALIAKRSQPQFIRQWRTTGELNGHIEEMYTGHALVKVFGQQPAAQRTFDERNGELYDASFKAQFISGTIQPAMGFIANLNYVIIAVVGGLRVASGTMTLGDVQAFIQYSRQFTQPITQIAAMMNMLQSGAASAERVYALLDAEEQSSDPATPARLDRVAGRVAFEDVSFSYSPDAPLIENLSLVAEPGQTVAIVGPTGAGKTTLVNLIMRFYDVDSGRITLDGVDSRDLTRDDLRRSVGMVLQDTWLFEGTIAQNIVYPIEATRHGGELTPDVHARMMRAAEATHVDAFVHSLPDGYDTVVTEEGGSLSAGERQLLTIARAFVADPPILILDEATSSVDTRTEVLVQKAMNALRVGRTSFVIAHRLSTITGADTIVVMEHGRIVEQGSHAELLERDGAYRRLYQSQFAAPVEDEESDSAPVH